jgi:hypothetical protein
MTDNTITGGYVAIYRRLREHELYMRKPLEWRAIWLHLLLSVNYADDTPARSLKRGEGIFVWSCTKQFLRDCSYEQWRRCVAYLKDEKMIAYDGDTHKITILQYSDYQPSEKTQDESSDVPVRKKKSTPATPAEPKTTWLTPFVEIWQKTLGGNFPFGVAAKELSALKTLGHTEATICKAFDKYIATTEARFVSIPHFASRFNTYIGDKKTQYDKSDILVRKES